MKYTDEQKQKFRDLVASGKSLKDAAAESGISLAIGLKIRGEDNRKKRGDSSPPLEEAAEEKEEENLSEGAVPPPGAGGGGASDGSGARGADGARSALTDEEDEKEEGEDDTGEQSAEEKAAAEEQARKEEEKKKNAVDPAETLVNLSEILTAVMVWGFAKRKKIKLTPAQREELAWSEEERVQLLRYARPVVAILPGILMALGPYVGLLFYGWLLKGVIVSRCEQVAAWGSGKKEDAGEDEEIRDAEWEEKKATAPLNDTRESW